MIPGLCKWFTAVIGGSCILIGLIKIAPNNQEWL